ncbi:LysR family transcriptional regulator [Pistricoccus aurantiacus]|uniref:LysR family transcriptional regulator n=1 Tax=Pistricoccus aurantiacus TaxID=1883414 RepID=A0A5B8SR50_9GAMM|nr:LysR family transcriptional regulator [Pistricoccus aurantiacus]QEA38741.1 LysR family transcriptional regulator [Pistricoccus aurantiacus]
MATNIPRISLEQWAVLQAVVDEGSFARAAESLNKSQSAVSYTLKSMQEQLPVEMLIIRGRKAELTEAGETLLRRARVLIEEALSLERLAANLAQDWEPEVRLAIEIIFPPELLGEALAAFIPESRSSRVQLIESVLSGTHEALVNGKADLIVTNRPPPGLLGQPLLSIEFVAVAHPQHPLHHMGRELTEQDLRTHRQFVVRDTGIKRSQDAGWLGAEERWTVSQLKTSIQFVTRGLGFAWLPLEHIRQELETEMLKPLPLAEGGSRHEELYLVFANRDSTGPATQALAEALQRVCRDYKQARQ